MELTGTNRPKAYIIVIFVLCVCVHCTVLRQQVFVPLVFWGGVLLCGFAVVIAGGKRSVSFSNLVAKPCGVDGTASWWVWESRWLPQFFCEWGSPLWGPLFFLFVPPRGGACV